MNSNPHTLGTPVTVFSGQRQSMAGTLGEVLLALHQAGEAHPPVVVFDDCSGRTIDFDLRGSADEVLARLAPPDGASADGQDAPVADTAESRSRGRPRLGVVAREVTLLPRHWDWLAQQPGGASVALRKLVEEARRVNAAKDRARQATDATFRVLSVLAGDLPGFEDATRALFAQDAQRFADCIAPWPEDVRGYALRLSAAGCGRDATA